MPRKTSAGRRSSSNRVLGPAVEKADSLIKSAPAAAVKPPEDTSDYGSEVPSRSISPSGSNSEIPASGDPSPAKSLPAKSTDQVSQDNASKLRPVNKAENLDETTEELFVKEENQVDAAVATGIISEDLVKEEERISAKLDKEEEKAQKQDQGQDETLTQEEKLNRLMFLLKKSQLFTEYLAKKIESQKTNTLKEKNLMERKRIRDEKKEQENLQKRTATPDKAAKGSPRGASRRSKGSLQPLSQSSQDNVKKRPLDENESDVPAGKRSKSESNDKDRKFEGEDVPVRQPLLLSGGIMREYQLDGYEWMVSMWENGINGILADEMGLGKTIQCIALICHLYEMGVPGPYLVVAPLSTVPNWVNEFKRFAPKVPCILYHGSQDERAALRSTIHDQTQCSEINKKMYSVVVTSFEIAMNDRAALQSVSWRFLVVDEGHRLKNRNCRLMRELKLYRTTNRLLLTGTPLQNDMAELWSLLNFIMPELFDDLNVFQSWFDAKELHEDSAKSNQKILMQEQKQNIVTTLHQILTPFLLRRIKSDVDLQIPPKKEVLVYCPLTKKQEEMYRAAVERTLSMYFGKKEEPAFDESKGRGKRAKPDIDYSVFLDGTEYKNDERFERELVKVEQSMAKYRRDSSGTSCYQNAIDKMSGPELNYSAKSRLMDLRKIVNHPYLVEYPMTDDGMFYKIDGELVTACGKLRLLDQMLTALLQRGHKILIFSQMTRMLDILADFLNLRDLSFSRLDGSMNFMDRQENIDNFNKDPNTQIFLLSTRAGGLGINLTAADTCIIYDSDWNPQQDLQAQDRCHRIGQSKPVMVYRLVTRGTIDQKIVERAAAKRKLEKLIIHRGKFKSTSSMEAMKTSQSVVDPRELLELLNSSDHVGTMECPDGQILSETDLNHLLDRRDLSWAKASQKNDVKETTTKKNAAKTVRSVEGVFRVLDQAETNNSSGLQSVMDR